MSGEPEECSCGGTWCPVHECCDGLCLSRHDPFSEDYDLDDPNDLESEE